MNVNNIKLYDNFVEILKINNLENNKNIKEFMLKNSVNDLILKYEELTSISEVYGNEQKLFRSIFYENVCDYIMNNNFHSIKNIKVIFLLFSYISSNKMYLLIQYLYPLLDNTNKTYFHYEMIITIYTVMVNKSEYKNMEYYELLNNLYKEEIIRNPLYTKKEEKEDENYMYISLFDFFVYASYIYEDCNVSLIFMKIMLNILESYNNEMLMNFYSTTVNLDGLYTLCENINNKNDEYLDIIEKDEKESNIYVNTFSYFVSKLFIHMNKYNLISRCILDTNEVRETINDLINYYYSNILYSEIHKNNIYLKMDINFDPLESGQIIGDLFKVNHKIMYKIYIDSYNKSKGLSPISKVFMIMVWFRFIYFKLNKYNKSYVMYDSNKDNYYIKKLNKEVILERKEYINDIIIYMNDVYENDESIYDFLSENIKQFILYDYENIVKKCNSCIEKSCSICLDEVSNNNINICYFCNKVFHDSCINQLWTNNLDHCPLCRKAINSAFYTFSKIRYEFLKDILDKL